jgi:hypothetical protein
MEGKNRPVRLKPLPVLFAVAVGALSAWALKGGSGWGGSGATPRIDFNPASTVPAAPAQEPPAPAPAAPGAASAVPEAAANSIPQTLPAGDPGAPGALATTAPPAPAGDAPAGDAPPPPDPGAAAEPAPAAAPPAEEASVDARRLEGKLRFREIWAYLLSKEAQWPAKAPITDLCLFDLSLDVTGRLKGDVNVKAVERASARGIRTHLVIASSGNKSLLHFALSPQYGVRQALLAEIAELPRRHAVNGVQLDIEGPRVEERADLLSFIRDLRQKLPAEVVLSLAIPAKTRDEDAAYRYADLAGVADRLFIMTYDQHWRGGPPGAISDLAWHDRVLAFAGAHLPRDRVVVGLPFYGRVWQREEVAKALNHSQAAELASKTTAPVRRDPARSHSFTFRTEVSAECWFEDAISLRAKLESAQVKGFRNVGFWRLGQEDPRIWDLLERE